MRFPSASPHGGVRWDSPLMKSRSSQVLPTKPHPNEPSSSPTFMPPKSVFPEWDGSRAFCLATAPTKLLSGAAAWVDPPELAPDEPWPEPVFAKPPSVLLPIPKLSRPSIPPIMPPLDLTLESNIKELRAPKLRHTL